MNQITPQEIKKLREALGISQGELAQLVGASTFRTILRYELAQTRPLPIIERNLTGLKNDYNKAVKNGKLEEWRNKTLATLKRNKAQPKSSRSAAKAK